ncbi:MAG: hypothetical protein HY881_26095 [Deltaproteobacteria bacterium]|nr:hypothetical protein [Deltaproteobacteria bacterium]
MTFRGGENKGPVTGIFIKSEYLMVPAIAGFEHPAQHATPCLTCPSHQGMLIAVAQR